MADQTVTVLTSESYSLVMQAVGQSKSSTTLGLAQNCESVDIRSDFFFFEEFWFVSVNHIKPLAAVLMFCIF